MVEASNKLTSKGNLRSKSTTNKIILEKRVDEPVRRKPDIDLAKQLLGWEPKTSLSEGMDLTINYFRNL